ncbi:hypothetical protein ABXJ76_16735 [Methylobacter sp. G7]
MAEIVARNDNELIFQVTLKPKLSTHLYSQLIALKFIKDGF